MIKFKYMVATLIMILLSNCNKIIINNLVVINKNINNELLDAAFKGNNSNIKNLLKMGADINFQDNLGKTPLINAVLGNKKKQLNF